MRAPAAALPHPRDHLHLLVGGAVCMRRSVPRGRSRPVASGQPHTYGVRPQWPRRMAYTLGILLLLPFLPPKFSYSCVFLHISFIAVNFFTLCSLCSLCSLRSLRSLCRSRAQRNCHSQRLVDLSLAMELTPRSALAELQRRRKAEKRRNTAIAAALANGKPAPLKRVRLSVREQEADMT